MSLRAVCVIALTALAVPLTPTAATASTHTVPASIDRTGERDVTTALSEFIAGVPDDATISFPAGATFRVEGVLAVEGRRDLVLDFNGARLVADTDGSRAEPHHRLAPHWPRHRAHLYIFDSSGIEVRDLVVRGPHEDGGTSEEAWRVEYEAQHAVEVARSTDVTIEGCALSQIFGDGVYIGKRSEQVRVRGCEIHHNGRQGIAVTSARDVIIEENHLHDIRRTAFDLEPIPDNPIENIVIRNNHIGRTRLNFVSGHGHRSTFTGVRILENTLDAEMEISLRAPEGTRRGSVEIRGNRSTHTFGSPSALFKIKRYDDVTIADNVSPFDGRAGGVAITIKEGCRVDIRDNAFTNVERQQDVDLLPGCATGGAGDHGSPSTAEPTTPQAGSPEAGDVEESPAPADPSPAWSAEIAQRCRQRLATDWYGVDVCRWARWSGPGPVDRS